MYFQERDMLNDEESKTTNPLISLGFLVVADSPDFEWWEARSEA